MKDWTVWREGVRQLDLLAHWREQGRLDGEGWRRARALVDAGPAGAPWRGMLEQLSLWLSVLLLGSAVICFIAANWDALDRFARLYGAQALLAAAALAAWRFGLARPVGQALLLLAGLLLGGVLALVGQTYQTGADTWQLFALWAALLLPWLLVAQSPAMSLLWALVANVALALLVSEWWRGDMEIWLALGLFNVALAVAWDAIGGHVAGLAGHLGPRLLVAAGLLGLTLAALGDVFGWYAEIRVGLPAWLIVVAAVGLMALRRRDLPLLSVASLSVIAVATSLLARLFLDAFALHTFGLLVLTASVLAQVAFASDRLRRLALEWADERA